MYFISRRTAGHMLAEELAEYRYENCVVVSLNDGSALVAAEIAARIHALLTLMLTTDIDVPGEGETYGTMDQSGNFSYNQRFSEGQRQEYYNEYHGMIEENRRTSFQQMNRLIADGGLVDKDTVRYQTVILVSDGLKDVSALNAANAFFGSVKLQKLVVATPIASVEAVDRMHIIADEIHCLSVTDNFLDTNHYYDDNNLPDHPMIVELIKRNVLNWA